MTATEQEVEAGQAIYTPRTLAVYDLVVHRFSNRLAWKCPTQKLVDHYNRHITNNHLDVGVGTGMLLDRCLVPPSSDSVRIGLMDINQASLSYAARRLRQWRPETWLCNVLEPIDRPIPKFDSIGLNYLLHCLPGNLESKCVALDNLTNLMNEKTRIFGSTILHEAVPRNWLAKRLMKTYNRRGIFSNRSDNAETLTQELKKRFHNVEVRTIGCVALFSACASPDHNAEQGNTA